MQSLCVFRVTSAQWNERTDKYNISEISESLFIDQLVANEQISQLVSIS